MTHLTHQDIIVATGGVLHGTPFDVSSISIDSRTIMAGQMYMPIRGEQFDGHAFIKDAFAKGASAALVDKDVASYAVFGPVILVPSVEKALWHLGAFNRGRLNAKVIAITGSSGKTSTKEMLWRVLERQGKTFGNAGSFNNHWGLPLTLANCPIDTDYAILEMGMNHMGEIAPMSRLGRPDIACINNISPAHIGFLGSIENIAQAKAEIFEGLSSSGVIIVHGDSPCQDILKTAAGQRPFETFGGAAENDAQLLSYRAEKNGAVVDATIQGKSISYKLETPGAHYAMNSVGALLICATLGVSIESAAKDLVHFTPVSGRGNCLDIVLGDGMITLIDESYNASPEAVGAALRRMCEMPCHGRRLFVLGDMRELGAAAVEQHKNIWPVMQENKIDLFFGCGEDTQHLFACVPDDIKGGFAPTAATLKNKILAVLKPGDLVMVKGSLSMGMKQIVTAISEEAKDP